MANRKVIEKMIRRQGEKELTIPVVQDLFFKNEVPLLVESPSIELTTIMPMMNRPRPRVAQSLSEGCQNVRRTDRSAYTMDTSFAIIEDLYKY